MNSRIVLFFVTLMTLALFASASPVPANEGVLVKKALKQYNARRAVQRRDDFKPKPSK